MTLERSIAEGPLHKDGLACLALARDAFVPSLLERLYDFYRNSNPNHYFSLGTNRGRRRDVDEPGESGKIAAFIASPAAPVQIGWVASRGACRLRRCIVKVAIDLEERHHQMDIAYPNVPFNSIRVVARLLVLGIVKKNMITVVSQYVSHRGLRRATGPLHRRAN